MEFFTIKGRLDCNRFLYLSIIWGISLFLLLTLSSLKIFPIGLFVIFIALILSYIFLVIRRLHDLNLSGYWLLLCPFLNFVALVIGNFVAGEEGCEIAFILTNLFFGFILFSRSGSEGANRYGEPSVK